MKLGAKQRIFHRMFFHSFLPRAWAWAIANEVDIVVRDTFRTPAEALANAQAGSGIKNSLHNIGLAVDLQLFEKGVYLTDSARYASLGQLWKSFSTQIDGKPIVCCWGGDFKRKDGGHFSVEHEGVR